MLLKRFAGTWLRSLWVWDRKDRRALEVQLIASRTFARLRYSLRLAFDGKLRALVQRQRWLDGPAG